MKTKLTSLAMLMAMLLSLGIFANAADVSPLWNGGNQCNPVLTFSGNTANCITKIVAKESTAKVSATMTLYRINDNGGLVQVASWPGLSGTGRLDASRSYPYGVSGSTYRLVVNGTVVDSSGSSPVSKYCESRCP